MAKKKRATASAKQQRHDETCMCRRCRAKIEAVFYRKGTKTRLRDYMDWDNEGSDNEGGGG